MSRFQNILPKRNQMKTHRLKTWDIYFQPILEGKKRFELRKNDRNFKEGDRLKLEEVSYKNPTKYSGRSCTVDVDYILHGDESWLNEDYCIMSITKIT